jgi:hypothetical protein
MSSAPLVADGLVLSAHGQRLEPLMDLLTPDEDGVASITS